MNTVSDDSMTASFPQPVNEVNRLKALLDFNILDTFPEQAYDNFTKLASVICGTPIALITLLDEQRQWFKSKVGLEVSETPREYAFCAHAIMEPDQVMVVKDATKDQRFAANPLVTSDPNIKFYAGAPLVTSNGEALGTICVIDRLPREIRVDQIEALKILSHEIVVQFELRRSINTLEKIALTQEQHMEQLQEDNRTMQKIRSELESQAMIDPLTEANNRRAFDRKLQEECIRTRRHSGIFSMLIMDVDHFKLYNDSFGHPAGDELLIKLTCLLKMNIRAYDFLARYGGEEFVFILPNTSLKDAMIIAERFRRTIEMASWPSRPITVSIGVAEFNTNFTNPTELVQHADQALYRAKQNGRNRISV